MDDEVIEFFGIVGFITTVVFLVVSTLLYYSHTNWWVAEYSNVPYCNEHTLPDKTQIKKCWQVVPVSEKN